MVSFNIVIIVLKILIKLNDIFLSFIIISKKILKLIIKKLIFFLIKLGKLNILICY